MGKKYALYSKTDIFLSKRKLGFKVKYMQTFYSVAKMFKPFTKIEFLSSKYLGIRSRTVESLKLINHVLLQAEPTYINYSTQRLFRSYL